MAQRYWKKCRSMGYAGTDSEDFEDISERWEDWKEKTDEEVESTLAKEEWEAGAEMVDAWAEAITKEEYEEG